MEQILEHFSRYIKLSDELTVEITKRIQIRSFKKGELVHDAEKVYNHSYFIQQGILRTYFYKEGKEVSEYFCSNGEWTNSPRSFMQRRLDHYYIDAIEDTLVFGIDIGNLGYLFDHFPEMERYARLSMGSVFGQILERIESMRFTTAKEKYEHFCSFYKAIYHRIPLGMVASYLGITQETLSRVRAGKSF
ncbi:Crp/Fnr family transcriptional regulator [Pedobacter insulae]|uniref:cAMP-binding domain of CRP or a regulatory subunit of cAMP-dependent protein kinases n=1 Tax=Pedobacter insulae TaxID=414048 RepID=A0A1I2X8H0_9SPHI|nr:Crp/Fnr family transcriptional regulator [Pedobacter insulae]SFH09823.1 cAMP-binding domain of CRP or a regulatory subunit of cAMP-dependent protein kinases [Pedobacter insulae]